VTVLRRGYVPVEPDVTGFDDKLKDKIRQQDPGGKAGKQIGGQLNRALKKVNLDPIDIKGNPRDALAAIRETELKLRALAGDSATVEVKIQTERALGQLARFKKQLGDVVEDEAAPVAARGFVNKFSEDVNQLLQKAPINPGIVAAGVAAAPLLAGVISGAVVGAAGLGGVIGGITLAARDPAVQTAGLQLGATLLGGLQKRASGFVQPTLDGIAKVERRFNELGPDLDRIFASSRFVDPLVNGITRGAQGFVKGFADAIENADPVIRQLSSTFERLGTATGDLFSKMGQNAEEGASAIGDLTDATVEFIDKAGDTVVVLTRIYGAVDNFNDLFEKTTHGLSLLEAFNPAAPFLSLYEALNGTKKSTELTTAALSTYQEVLEKTRAAAGGVVDASKQMVATDDDVKASRVALTQTQEDFNQSLANMGPAGSEATRIVDGLRKATASLYGTQESGIDANEAYQASWDGLSESVKSNKRSLDVHTAAGRANRDALEALLTSSRDMYFADINAGVAIDDARKKHEKRTGAIEREAGKLKLNKDATKDLIGTYGKIPAKKETDLVLDGVSKVVSALKDLYVYQRSLATGEPIGSIIAQLNKEKGPAKRYGGYHTGGFTGDGGKYEPAGIVHRSEFVLRKEATSSIARTHPGLLEEMNATGQVPGYAAGGQVAPVEARGLRYLINARGTEIPSRAQVAAKVTPEFGNWPSSPSAQRGDSGVWRRVVALIKGTGPVSGSFGNAYRPGDPLWHGSGRAVDWMGYEQDALATFLASKRPLELIHRTAQRDYAYTRGKNKGSFNEGLMNAHRNHVHIAMDDGGMRMLQPGMNLIPNGTGRPEPIAGPAAMAALGGDVHIHIHDSVITSERAAVDLVARAYNTAVAERKIRKP